MQEFEDIGIASKCFQNLIFAIIQQVEELMVQKFSHTSFLW